MAKSISINVTSADADTLRALVDNVPLANRHAVARLALRLGLASLAAAPDRIPELLSGQATKVALGSG